MEKRLPYVDEVTRASLANFTLKSPEEFKEKADLGEGTFGKVYQAKINDKMYALKKIKMEDQKNGFPVTSVREIMVLRKLHNHPNIIQLVDIVRSKGQAIYLVFEFAKHDLQKLISQPQIIFNKMQLKYILQQMLIGM